MEWSEILGLFTGPTGGALGFAFGMGFGTGYQFAQRTTLKMALDQIDQWKNEARHWRDAYTRATGNQ